MARKRREMAVACVVPPCLHMPKQMFCFLNVMHYFNIHELIPNTKVIFGRWAFLAQDKNGQDPNFLSLAAQKKTSFHLSYLMQE